ncbi:MAG: phosphatidylcholine/phosphatidylserine synthase [Proteobacteria bacterium]|nr:phosphatidylcholine/phosphatidylserine synthase [Pseudomonadota bacterium]
MSKFNTEESYFPLAKLLPNFVTLIALCIGLSSLRFALNENWVAATAFIVVATFLDGIDGRLARFLNSTSEFGAQLDSLVDFFNFGIAPSLVIYMWLSSFSNIKGFDWALVLFFAICMTIRLARFNVGLEKKSENPLLTKYFFQGIPAPCGAGLCMLPMILTHEFGSDYFFTNPVIVIAYVFILALAVASTIPTISVKSIPIRNEYVHLTLAALGLMIVGFVIEPWLTLAIMGVLYFISIPVTALYYLKIKYSK